jgi:serine/threonine protein kinase
VANEDEKAKQVGKVEQHEEFGPIAHEGGRAKALRVKMPAQRALQMANEKVDADTPPKQSVSVDAGERKEHKGKTKVKRSKTTLRKQKCARKEKPPRSGIMVSLGLALAVVAFTIAAAVAVGVPSFSPRYHHVNKKDKFNLYVSYTGCEEADEQYADMGTTRLGTRVLLVDHDFADALQTDKHACASWSISSPFHMIAALPYASVPLEPEARAEGGDQCDRDLRAKDERIKANEERIKANAAYNEEKLKAKDERIKALKKANEEMLEEKNDIIHMQENALQANSGMARVHHSSRVTRGQPTPARNARRKFRHTSPLISSSPRPLHVPVRIYNEGAVQLWKGLPLAVSVDAGSGNDSLSCIPSSSSAASTSLTSSCKTIHYALEHGQIAARKTSSPLELAVSAGVYLGECSENGNIISISTAVKKAGGSTGVVKIDCEKKGKAFNVTQDPTSTFHLERLTIANGKSARGGAAFVEGGSMALKDCVFDDLESLASAADGDFVGGGAIMFVGAVSLYADGCSFTKCRAASGSGGGILVSFHALDGGWATAAHALTILRSQFDRCGAGVSGGAVAAVAADGVGRVDVLIDGTAFDGSSLRSAGSGSVRGGHLYFSYLGGASNTNTMLRGCNFTNGLMESTNTVAGACYLGYSATATNVHQQIDACIFENNTLIGANVYGSGGVSVYMRGVSTNTTLLFDRCFFLANVLQGEGDGSSANGGGVYIQFHGGDVRLVLLLVSHCSFERNLLTASGAGARAEGGGLKMVIEADATDVHQQIKGCTFENNTLGTSTSVYGGGVAVYMRGVSTNTTLLFDRCFFLGNELRGGTIDAVGGGVYIQLSPGYNVRSVLLLLVSRSSFERNLLTASGARATAKGGGMYLLILADATDVTSTFDRCSFAHNVLRAEGEGGRALGGGISLGWYGFAAGGLLTSLLDSTFVGNRLAGGTGGGSSSYGGAVTIVMQTTSAYTGPMRTLVDRCQFLANVAGGAASSHGGAIYHVTTQPGASLHVVRSVTRGNSASGLGGGIYALQTEATPPTNLEMTVTYLGPTHTPHYACKSAHFAGREYSYGSPVLIDSSIIDNNTAISRDGTGSGGGVCAHNVNMTVRNSSVDNNTGGGTGGGFQLEGSARLTLEGGTSVKDNAAAKDGTAIHSSSEGSIKISDTTSVVFRRDEAASGIAVLSGGKLEYDALTRLSCPPGESMLYNISIFAGSSEDWKIDCTAVHAYDNGTRIEYVNPTCAQLQIGNSPLHTRGCTNMPMTPATVMTTGSVRCSKCSSGMHAPIGSTITGGDSKHPKGACILCDGGKYTDEAGSAQCKSCPVGSVTPTKGSLGCTPCSPGRFASREGQLSCHLCSSGRFQDGQGQGSCGKCSAFTTSEQGASECKIVSNMTIVIIVLALLLALAYPAYWVYRYIRRQRRSVAKYRERVTKLNLSDYVDYNILMEYNSDIIDGDIEEPLMPQGGQSINAADGNADRRRSCCCGLIKGSWHAPNIELPDWAIDYDHLTFGDVIGRGATAEVVKGLYNPTKGRRNIGEGQEVAIKEIKLNKNDLGYKSKIEAAVKELKNLWTLKDDRVLQLYGASLVEKNGQPVMNLVTELCIGSMEVYIDAEIMETQGLVEGMPVLDNSPSGRRKLLELMEQVAGGIAYMHSQNPPIIHRDLKPQNIFISSDGVAKIGDFGLSIKHKTQTGGLTLAGASHTANIGIQGTPMYIAPEMMDVSESYGDGGTEQYSPAIDVYAFGIILNAMWRGEKPYNTDDFDFAKTMPILNAISPELALLQAVKGDGRSDGIRPHIPSGCEPWLSALMKDCWVGDPRERKRAQEVADILRISLKATRHPAGGPSL